MLRLESQTTREDGKVMLPLSSAVGSPKLKTIHRRISRYLVPTFLSQHEPQSRDIARPTDFLDGMRGYAAFSVFFCHFVMPAHPKGHIGYGGGNGKTDHWIPQLPILRLPFSGQACVFLFFVISGFSISLKPLSLARRGNYATLFDTLVSATFRRASRLYIPCVVTLIMSLFLACWGAFNYTYTLTKHWPFPGNPLSVPTVSETAAAQIKDWAGHMWAWADPLNWKTFPDDMPYGTQLWTIPVELRCSLITWVAILGLAKTSATTRIGTLAAVTLYLQLRSHPEVALFLAGAIVAELYLIRLEHAADSAAKPAGESRRQRVRNTVIFIFGLFLLSYPRKGGDKALFWGPFYPIAKLIVGDVGKNVLYLFTFLGSTLVVYVVSRSPSLQALFTTPLARYLGKISFSLYCIHIMLLDWFGYRNIVFWWAITGKKPMWRYELGIGIAFLFQAAITMWVADVFWRLVDEPSVRFTKWLEEKCTASN